ncbi:MAG: RecX family transcriptional regulator [Eubacteriales bacterium]|nr:RecX family transcriptional regulator [Eubacteriales bacterium]
MIISHNRGRGKKIHLLIDDEYQITTDIDFWADHSIKDGTEISQDEWDALVDAIQYKKALDKCYDLLSRRDHSTKELRTKLLRSIDEGNADKAIRRMKELGYLDDYRYAKSLLQYLVEGKKMSKSFVKQEFYKRGIPADITNDVIGEYEFDNESAVYDLLCTKYRNKLLADNGTEKVTNALLRKGFSYSDIKSAFRKIEIEGFDE